MPDKLVNERSEQHKRAPGSHQPAESGLAGLQQEAEDELIRRLIMDTSGSSLTPKAILSLQRVHGNHLVQRLLAQKRQQDNGQHAAAENVFPVIGKTVHSDAQARVDRQVSEAISPQTMGNVLQRGQDADIAGFDRSIVPKNIHQGQQDKHIKTSSNYKNAVKSQGVHKSAITADPADLLNRFHAGEFTVLAYDARRKSVVVDFDSDIGEVIEESTGNVLNTTKYGSVRFGAKGVHIIPINYTV